MLLENFLVLVSTSFSFISTRLFLFRTPFLRVSAFAFFIYHVIQFLLPSHIALPCFVVRQIPLPQTFDILCSLRCSLASCEIFKILLDRLFCDILILIEYINKFRKASKRRHLCRHLRVAANLERSSIFPTLISQFNFGIANFQIFESINSLFLFENVIRADEDYILFLEIAVGFTFVQSFRVAQSLIITGSLW